MISVKHTYGIYTARIMYLTGQSGDVLSSDLSLTGRMMLMSTYEEFMIILTVVLVMIEILNMKNKK